MIWCEPRVIITINKVVTGRFAPGKTDNITNGYAKIQKIIQKDCRNAENPHCIFRIFAVTARAPAGDSNRSSVMPRRRSGRGRKPKPSSSARPRKKNSNVRRPKPKIKSVMMRFSRNCRNGKTNCKSCE